MVSHELRTPMTSVKTSLALLLEGAGGALEPAAHELLEVALRNADRLIRLVNDLLDLSRLEAGRMELRLEPVALEDAVGASVEMVAAFAESRGVTLRTEPPAEPQVVRAERDRVVQVIVNLLSNAINVRSLQTARQLHNARARRRGAGAHHRAADCAGAGRRAQRPERSGQGIAFLHQVAGGVAARRSPSVTGARVAGPRDRSIFLRYA